MPHPLVTQLHFARREFVRCLDGISAEDAVRRLEPMNCLSWIVGHLANQERAYWVYLAQGSKLHAELDELVGYGKPATTPPLDEMWATWRAVTTAADEYLNAATTSTLQTFLRWRGVANNETVGSLLQRNIYHYWFHMGEAHAIRQQLGHTDLPQFVGDMSAALYQPEQE